MLQWRSCCGGIQLYYQIWLKGQLLIIIYHKLWIWSVISGFVMDACMCFRAMANEILRSFFFLIMRKDKYRIEVLHYYMIYIQEQNKVGNWISMAMLNMAVGCDLCSCSLVASKSCSCCTWPFSVLFWARTSSTSLLVAAARSWLSCTCLAWWWKRKQNLKVIYHPLYGMNNYVLIWGDWLSCDPLRRSHDSQSPHIWGWSVIIADCIRFFIWLISPINNSFYTCWRQNVTSINKISKPPFCQIWVIPYK